MGEVAASFDRYFEFFSFSRSIIGAHLTGEIKESSELEPCTVDDVYGCPESESIYASLHQCFCEIVAGCKTSDVYFCLVYEGVLPWYWHVVATVLC